MKHFFSSANVLKIRISFFLAVIFFIALFSQGCGDDSSTPTNNGGNQTTSGTASFTLNGAGFSNQTYTLSAFTGGFEADENATGIAGSNGTEMVSMTMFFPGNSTGTFQFSDNAAIVINSGPTTSLRGFTSAPGGGQIVVTAFGNVSGNITGTFSGKIYEATAAGLDSVTVTNGSFSAVRVK